VLRHLIHGLREVAEIEHMGAVLAVTVTRAAKVYGAPCTLGFDGGGGGFAIDGPAAHLGRVWHRVRHGNAVLLLRVGYEYRDARPILYIDAPREWRVRWAGDQAEATP
jgi:hypothetical protein